MPTDFDWSPQPRAAAWVAARSRELRSGLPFAEELRKRLLAEAGVRFDDLIDTICLGDDEKRLPEALASGWERRQNDAREVYDNANGIFPKILVYRKLPVDRIWIELKVESVSDFRLAWELPPKIIGDPDAQLGWGDIAHGSNVVLGVVEGLSWSGECETSFVDSKKRANTLANFRGRRRDFADDAAGFAHTERLLDEAIAAVGRDVACQLFFTAEREYWMSRNAAGRAQYARQQRLGIGWANHDHHTYRSSRAYFSRLVGLWEKLGFVCRERFYAGREAGWGAQVMEHPITGIVTFNDVDLTPDELRGDFAHEPLPPNQSLGTVGLWCGLHGESVLQAGMHHLEAQFSFDALRDQLAAEQIKMGKPFTDFPYLTQAFTEGERWPVAENRIARLLKEKLITPDQAEKFRAQGAIGSHLENLERNDGFKGFNQTGVSEIITATDPRKN